jgi:hypothetical protein
MFGHVIRRIAMAMPGISGPAPALVELAHGRGPNRSPEELGAATVVVIDAMRRSASAGGAPVPANMHQEGDTR